MLKKVFIGLILLIVLVAVAAVGGYFYVRVNYGIDLIQTVQQLNTLNEEVNEESLCPNAFASSDYVDVQTIVNESVENLITYTEENGYIINFDDLPEEMRYIVKLNDKQTGALAQMVVEQELDGKIHIGDKDVPIELKQIDFFTSPTNEVLINTTVKIDIRTIKDGITGALEYFKQYIPDYLYISSTVKNTKSGAFLYRASHSSLTINNLTSEQTTDLFHTLDVLLNIGTLDDLNTEIGTIILDTLIGNENTNGIAYSLKDIGATDYDFVFESDGDYFRVLR